MGQGGITRPAQGLREHSKVPRPRSPWESVIPLPFRVPSVFHPWLNYMVPAQTKADRKLYFVLLSQVQR